MMVNAPNRTAHLKRDTKDKAVRKYIEPRTAYCPSTSSGRTDIVLLYVVATESIVPTLEHHCPQLSVETSLAWSANLGLRVGIRCL
jgi:hypothetical protein